MSEAIIRSALKSARRLLTDDIDFLTESYWSGGTTARARGEGGVSPEGKHYLRPYKSAVKKIDAALAALTSAGGERG